jgi:N-acetylmuramoyl-L-alanine amidase
VRKVNKIILHCSASDDTKQTAAMIESWHKARGFKKIGYHFFIRMDGTIEKGRDLEEIGAHVEGHNADSIGICLAGLTKFSDKQFDNLSKLLKELKPKYPAATIHGHREFANKACPVYDYTRFKKEYEWTGLNLSLKIFQLLCKIFSWWSARSKS